MISTGRTEEGIRAELMRKQKWWFLVQPRPVGQYHSVISTPHSSGCRRCQSLMSLVVTGAGDQGLEPSFFGNRIRNAHVP